MEKLIVKNYYSKFIELSRFAPGVVETKKVRAQRFENGLSIDLVDVVWESFTSLNVLYWTTTHIYGL